MNQIKKRKKIAELIILNGKFVEIRAPFHREFIREVKKIPTRGYTPERKTWHVQSEYKQELLSLAARYFIFKEVTELCNNCYWYGRPMLPSNFLDSKCHQPKSERLYKNCHLLKICDLFEES